MKTSILVVEDNKKIASYLRESLEEEGYHLSIERQGDKAAYRIPREQPDIVILDIMLPGMNGDQICQTVRHEYRGKILMLTALDDLQNEVDLLNLGADDYLTKPFSVDRLKARVNALLRRPPLIREEDTYTFGQLLIHISQQSVSLANKKIMISPSDFELLALLVKNHDIPLSRDNICFALYGREYDGVDRGIDLKISRLRKALGDQHGEKIKTLHGKGYIFIGKNWE